MLWWTLRQARSGDVTTRKDAARKLGESRDPRAFAPLLELLGAPEPAVRKAAAEALGQFGSDVLAPLVSALADRDKDVRRVAFDTLQGIDAGWPTCEAARSAAPALVQAQETFLRVAAVASLATLGRAAVAPLATALADDEKDIREQAFAALEQGGPEWRQSAAARQAALTLAQALSGAGPHERKVASAVTLGWIGDACAVDPLIAVVRSGKHHVVAPAIHALGRIGDRRAVPALVERLRTSSDAVRDAARAALDTLDADWRTSAPAREAIPALEEQLREGDSTIRKTAAAVLRLVGWQPATDEQRMQVALATRDGSSLKPLGATSVDLLLPMLAEAQQGLDETALDLLYDANPAWSADVRAASAVPALREILRARDRAAPVRQRAARALGEIGSGASLEALVGVAMRSKDPASSVASDVLTRAGTRAIGPLLSDASDADKASAIIARMGAAAVTPVLVTARDAGERRARRTAAEALDKIGWRPETADERLAHAVAHERWQVLADMGRAAVPPLAARLQHEKATEACTAASVLARIGGKEAASALAGALGDARRDVRRAVASALDQITWTPPDAAEAVAYAAAREDWTAMQHLGSAAVERLAAALRDVDEPEGEKAAAALAYIGTKEAFGALKAVVADYDLPTTRRKAAADALDTMGRAFDRSTALAYELLRGNWDGVVRLGPDAIETIGRHHMSEKAGVEALGRIGDPRAIDVILRHYVVVQQQSGRAWVNLERDREVIGVLRGLLPLSTLTEALLGLIEGLWLHLDEAVVRRMCGIDSPVSSNLLRLVLEVQDWKYYTTDDCEITHTHEVSYEAQRAPAREELARRGNPPYRPEAYLKPS